jgi:hypothetical protein
LSHQRGRKQNKKYPKFKCNTVSISPSASSPSSVVVSSKEEVKKKESGDSFVNVYLRLQLTCHLLSAICCCRLYLLQISGLSFTLI